MLMMRACQGLGNLLMLLGQGVVVDQERKHHVQKQRCGQLGASVWGLWSCLANRVAKSYVTTP